jgi:hypothetical protein
VLVLRIDHADFAGNAIDVDIAEACQFKPTVPDAAA